LGIEQINSIYEKILRINIEQDASDENENSTPPANEGTIILDATACSQEIACLSNRFKFT
jgi:hypothetical protein